MSEVTVQQLDELVKKLSDKEKEIEAQGEVLKKLNKEYQALEGRCVHYLKDLQRENYDCPFGKIKIEQKWRVNMPKDDNAKMLLFDHLKERGIFEKFASVHAQSLNSLYMKDWEEAQRLGQGMEFSMPGIDAPKLHEALRFKAAK